MTKRLKLSNGFEAAPESRIRRKQHDSLDPFVVTFIANDKPVSLSGKTAYMQWGIGSVAKQFLLTVYSAALGIAYYAPTKADVSYPCTYNVEAVLVDSLSNQHIFPENESCELTIVERIADIV